MTGRTLAVGLLDPSPPGIRGGNRVTALRWALLTRRSGHAAFVEREWDGRPCDVLVALHAERSAASIRRWRAAHPARPLVVALTGTDIHPSPPPTVLASLRAATRIVVLHEAARATVPAPLLERVVVLPQSFAGCTAPPPPYAEGTVVALLANLRAVKDPLLAARAAGLLPSSSGVRIEIAGGVIEPEVGAAVRRAAEASPHLRWLGPLRRRAALVHLARSHAALCTSRHEGGAGVVGEALAFGVPVLSTDVPATCALLGADHPGLFPVGDAGALARLLVRLEAEPAFRAELAERSRGRAPLVDRGRELAGWAALLDSLAAGEDGTR